MGRKQTRIVCAAARHRDTKETICSPRHGDKLMTAQMVNHNLGKGHWEGRHERGFVDQFGRFHTRTKAKKIAEEAGQLLQPTKTSVLYPEDIY